MKHSRGLSLTDNDDDDGDGKEDLGPAWGGVEYSLSSGISSDCVVDQSIIL